MTLHQLRHRVTLTAQDKGIDNAVRKSIRNTMHCDAIEQHNTGAM